jgi:hypothetical protein
VKFELYQKLTSLDEMVEKYSSFAGMLRNSRRQKSLPRGSRSKKKTKSKQISYHKKKKDFGNEISTKLLIQKQQ